MASPDSQPFHGGVAPAPNDNLLDVDADGRLVMVLPVYTSIFGNISKRPFHVNGTRFYSTSRLVCGYICTVMYPILRQASWRKVKWLPYMAAYTILDSYPLLDETVGVWNIIIAFALIALGWRCDDFIVDRVKHEATVAVYRQLTPVLGFLGYRAVYKIKATGVYYTKEHCIYVYLEEPGVGSLTERELLARIPRETGGSVREPAIVYLYGTLYKNLISRQWQQATRYWQDILVDCGWEMEYHHGNLDAAYFTLTDFWLRFVPVSRCQV